MYRIWYSTESFADYVIDHTILSSKEVKKSKIHESDASKPRDFHKVPDHIRKILYLDAPDLIIEYDNEPILSVEISAEAGTGHNSFQRFARIAAAVENGVPIAYIYPEAVIVYRKNDSTRWDVINPLIFKALESVMYIYETPALMFYYPSDYKQFVNCPKQSPNINTKGLINHPDIVKYPGCPTDSDDFMNDFFLFVNQLVKCVERYGIAYGREKIYKSPMVRDHRQWMQMEYFSKIDGKQQGSPLSATELIPTEYLINYLSQYEKEGYVLGELLKNREYTRVYKINGAFRGDPYPGALAAIDYMTCRTGKTYEDRETNLVLVFGSFHIDEDNKSIVLKDENGSTIKTFSNHVQSSQRNNLLIKNYEDLKPYEIPRYFMQVRYGSMYSKQKHIRVYSYFADAILFPDGAVWRDG